jgi:hypothetical protein
MSLIISLPSFAAERDLKAALLGPPPKWQLHDMPLLESWSTWSTLARVLEYDSLIWKQLAAESPEKIHYVMALLRSLILTSSVKITDEDVDPDTWARLKYRVACHQQLLEIVRAKMSEAELAALNLSVSKDDILAVYARTYAAVCNYVGVKYFSAGLPAPVAEEFSSNSSASPSAPLIHEMSESKDINYRTVRERVETGWWNLQTSADASRSNSSA